MIPTRTQLFPLFTNAYAYQATATIRIFEGEHYLTKYNTLLGIFILSGLTTNFAARTLEIAIRMDIDVNGVLRVDAEEPRSGAKASININVNAQTKLSRDDIERHLTFVQNDPNFAAKSIHDHKLGDTLYMLDGQIATINHNFSGELTTSCDRIPGIPLLVVIVFVLDSCRTQDGSFMLNKDLADVLHIDIDIFNSLENYLREQGFNSLALNIRNELLRLVGTGIILLWLILQIEPVLQNMSQILNNTEQIKTQLCNYLPVVMTEQINKAILFYQQTSQRNDKHRKWFDEFYRTLHTFTTDCFPLKSRKFHTGTQEYRDYYDPIRKMLSALELSSSFTLFEDEILSSINRFIIKLNDHNKQMNFA
ncbi:unnamed protein product [Rotaria sordida]|uniref:DNA-dependent protein kinase catalytic subunit CC1/2 domain-containing protein n=1 Tax=Rotaria sordida TaxID=392033 RepID=A0A819VCA2_9BILA|nr:unnamed protein product [Rotaria sordida]